MVKVGSMRGESATPDGARMRSTRFRTIGRRIPGGRRCIVAFLFAVVLAGCGSGEPKDLAGEWEITLPAGFRYQSRIERIDDSRYRIPSIVVLSGVYERRGNQLVIVEPNDPRLTEFVWEIQDPDHLVLVQSPPLGKIGSDYTGATLRRID